VGVGGGGRGKEEGAGGAGRGGTGGEGAPPWRAWGRAHAARRRRRGTRRGALHSQPACAARGAAEPSVTPTPPSDATGRRPRLPGRAAHQQEVYFSDDAVLQVVLGPVVFKLDVKAVLDADLHLGGGGAGRAPPGSRRRAAGEGRAARGLHRARAGLLGAAPRQAAGCCDKRRPAMRGERRACRRSGRASRMVNSCMCASGARAPAAPPLFLYRASHC
jgi:hypothetical protein